MIFSEGLPEQICMAGACLEEQTKQPIWRGYDKLLAENELRWYKLLVQTSPTSPASFLSTGDQITVFRSGHQNTTVCSSCQGFCRYV